MAGRVALICATLLITSCPDPEQTYNDWLETTADMVVSGDVTTDGGIQVDFSGNYLLAGMTPLGGPLMFETTVVVNGDLSSIDLTLQALKTDFLPPAFTNPREDARAPIGDPIVVTGVPFESNGTFEVALGEIDIAGDANPISGGDIVADLTLLGEVKSTDSFCGFITGMVKEPLELDLTGSTFGAVQTDDVTSVETPPVKCGEL